MDLSITNDRVLFFSPTFCKGQTNKFKSFFNGPHIIIEIVNDLNFVIKEQKSKKQQKVRYDRLKTFTERTKKAHEAEGKNNCTRNNAAKETKERENDFVALEFPHVNSKVAAPGRSTPKRDPINSVLQNSIGHQITIAASAFTETQPCRLADKSSRSVGSRAAPKIQLREKTKTGSGSKAASIVYDFNNESLNRTGGNKRYNTRKPSERSALKRFGGYVFYKDHDDDNEYDKS